MTSRQIPATWSTSLTAAATAVATGTTDTSLVEAAAAELPAGADLLI